MKLWQVIVWTQNHHFRLVSVRAKTSSVALKKALDKAKKILSEEDYLNISKIEVEEY